MKNLPQLLCYMRKLIFIHKNHGKESGLEINSLYSLDISLPHCHFCKTQKVQRKKRACKNVGHDCKSVFLKTAIFIPEGRRCTMWLITIVSTQVSCGVISSESVFLNVVRVNIGLQLRQTNPLCIHWTWRCQKDKNCPSASTCSDLV